MAFTIESPAFEDGGTIPQKYAKAGANVSPPLSWSEPPEGTRSLALVVEDPDAPSGTFRHWAVYNILPHHAQMPEAMEARDEDSLTQAVNDFGNSHYDGPKPPPGHGLHHYHFKLMALDTDEIELPEGARAKDVKEAAERHLLGEAEIVGTYEIKAEEAQ